MKNTNGKSLSSTFSWKIKNRVLENSSRQGKEKEDVSLIGVNAKTGQIFNMSAGSDGGSSLGEWKFSASGEASLGILYTAGTGQEGAFEHPLPSRQSRYFGNDRRPPTTDNLPINSCEGKKLNNAERLCKSICSLFPNGK